MEPGILILIVFACLVTRWGRRYFMGYQPKQKPLTLDTEVVEPLIYRLDVPKGMIANQCSRCLDVYLIRVPPSSGAEPSYPWVCNDCERKQKGVYR